MNELEIKIIITLSIIGFYIISNLYIKDFIYKTLKKFHFSLERRQLTIKLFSLISGVVGIIFLAAIWGIEKNQIGLFISSALTVLGVAFFAQWSVLSNITSGIIMYFNHPLGIGDNILIEDKDFPIEGIIIDISFFFMHIKTIQGNTITIPNNVVIQKAIKINK
ncbi:MAG: mechanosensitive ion channel [Chitinophagales bacterium]